MNEHNNFHDQCERWQSQFPSLDIETLINEQRAKAQVNITEEQLARQSNNSAKKGNTRLKVGDRRAQRKQDEASG